VVTSNRLLAAFPESRGAAPLPIVSEVITRDEWNAYVDQHPDGTGDHAWDWREIFAGVFGHEPMYLAARREDSVTGILPLVRFKSRLFGRFVVSLPFLNYGGVLASDNISRDALIMKAGDVAREFGASHVELRHRTHTIDTLACRQHKLALRRELPSASNDLERTIDRKARNQVRKARKDGLTATTGGAELVNDFYDVFASNMRDLGTPVYSKRFFSEALRLFATATRIHLVRAGEVTVAAAISMRHRDTLLIPWASSLRNYRQHCPNMLLYWTMLEHATATGVRTFDFGRSSPESGTHHFKLQWGATATPLHWEYLLLTRSAVPDHGPTNTSFAAAIAVWQRLPLWVTKAIGPAIVRNIP
jgi:FemAB-related protein (PEP-CTERM system-associated)